MCRSCMTGGYSIIAAMAGTLPDSWRMPPQKMWRRTCSISGLHLCTSVQPHGRCLLQPLHEKSESMKGILLYCSTQYTLPPYEHPETG